MFYQTSSRAYYLLLCFFIMLYICLSGEVYQLLSPIQDNKDALNSKELTSDYIFHKFHNYILLFASG
jgi:hypothetical protein